ncbi:hypothetical protein VSS37_09585 [Candidatus Thiothrix sp. Deng01]|uniref:Uncharacterized protein n=1 Tax=Candidatus Thiothrix phosphatis TaxID=3112415 RepID=A0ABU6CXF7_9GAMM|nr:hypothetical protein [Candidatus Thiothrix sp. Deng01]MEB4591227.1 hypothetical protein [Candidatus Thiothrix sp. Deng01]
MSKPITQGAAVAPLQNAVHRAARMAATYEKAMLACLCLASQYRGRAQECQRLAAMFDREAAANANLLQLSLGEKWRLEDAGREAQP